MFPLFDGELIKCLIFMHNDKLQLVIDIGHPVHILLDPGWMVQDESNDTEDLRARPRRILRLNLSQAAIDDQAKVIVAEEFALRLRIYHQIGYSLE